MMLPLIDGGMPRREVCLEPLHFTLSFLSFFHLFLSCGALLGDDLLEIEIDSRFLATLHPALDLVGRLFVVGRREYHKYGINARAQVSQTKFASAIPLALLLSALIAHGSNDNFGPRLPIHVHD